MVRFVAIVASLLAMVACGNRGGSAEASAGLPVTSQDGRGVILAFDKRVAIWVAIRATPESRANGWKEPLQGPVLVVYGTRGFNPAFTAGGRLRVAWLDGNRIVRIDEAVDQKYVSPPQEISSALLLPDGVETGMKAGDRVQVVEDR